MRYQSSHGYAASGMLICLNPGLICNFVEGTRRTSETTLFSTQVSVQNQVQFEFF